jgi:hypothetical protein
MLARKLSKIRKIFFTMDHRPQHPLAPAAGQFCRGGTDGQVCMAMTRRSPDRHRCWCGVAPQTHEPPCSHGPVVVAATTRNHGASQVASEPLVLVGPLDDRIRDRPGLHHAESTVRARHAKAGFFRP